MVDDPLDGITAFLAVAEQLSFTAAAARLGVTPTAVSKTIRLLERRHGVALFQRTTRKVGLTEAGRELVERLRPAARQIADALAGLGSHRDQPRGRLRLTLPRNATTLLLDRLVPAFRSAFPDVVLDLTLDDRLIDLVAEGYDAGVRLGESIQADMVAVPLTPPITWSIVGAPAYFARCGTPQTPEDLLTHQTLRYRFASAQAIHRWGFELDGRAFTVDTSGALIVNDRRLLLDLARQGLGLAFIADFESKPLVEAGQLQRVLSEFIPRDDGLFLYFPRHSQSQPKLRALIDTAKAITADPEFRSAYA